MHRCNFSIQISVPEVEIGVLETNRADTEKQGLKRKMATLGFKNEGQILFFLKFIYSWRLLNISQFAQTRTCIYFNKREKRGCIHGVTAHIYNPSTQELRKVGLECKTSLSYTASSKPTWISQWNKVKKNRKANNGRRADLWSLPSP